MWDLVQPWYAGRLSPAWRGRSVDDARAILRSYRALECHMEEPYFKMVPYLATRFGVLAKSLGWNYLSTDQLARHPGRP